DRRRPLPAELGRRAAGAEVSLPVMGEVTVLRPLDGEPALFKLLLELPPYFVNISSLLKLDAAGRAVRLRVVGVVNSHVRSSAAPGGAEEPFHQTGATRPR